MHTKYFRTYAIFSGATQVSVRAGFFQLNTPLIYPCSLPTLSFQIISVSDPLPGR